MSLYYDSLITRYFKENKYFDKYNDKYTSKTILDKYEKNKNKLNDNVLKEHLLSILEILVKVVRRYDQKDLSNKRIFIDIPDDEVEAHILMCVLEERGYKTELAGYPNKKGSFIIDIDLTEEFSITLEEIKNIPLDYSRFYADCCDFIAMVLWFPTLVALLIKTKAKDTNPIDEIDSYRAKKLHKEREKIIDDIIQEYPILTKNIIDRFDHLENKIEEMEAMSESLRIIEINNRINNYLNNKAKREHDDIESCLKNFEDR